MNIHLKNVGKKYRRNWIIKNITFQFKENRIYGIEGINGSGKSTLLKLISSILTPSEGKIIYHNTHEELPHERVRKSISFVAPYAQILPELTIQQTLDFHFSFKKMMNNMSKSEMLQRSRLENNRNMQVKELSSGMKQRLKLALAFFSNDEVLLLDEPTSNLDDHGIKWMQELIITYNTQRLIIIASNEKRDFIHCNKIISIKDWK